MIIRLLADVQGQIFSIKLLFCCGAEKEKNILAFSTFRIVVSDYELLLYLYEIYTFMELLICSKLVTPYMYIVSSDICTCMND